MTIRDTAAALARALVGGEQGRRIDDPIVQAVTEARIPRDRYSSCADHPHALRYLLGLRARVNRREAGSYQAGTRTMAWLCESGRVGAKLGHPCAVVPRATTRLDPGDTVILDVGHADRTHTCIVLERGANELVTADYGQHPFLGQRPEHIACRVVRRPLTVRGSKLWAGDRPIDSVLPLEAELAWAEREGTLRPARSLEEWISAHGTGSLPQYSAPIASAKAGPVPSPARGSTESGLPADQCRGIDLSEHQAVGAVDWHAAARLGYRYGIARLTNGTTGDARCVEHCRRIRDAGLTLGAYLFCVHWRTPAEMVAAFLRDAEACGYGEPGDLVPWLDVESWQGASGHHQAAPAWSPVAEETSERLAERFGGCAVYLNASDWAAMGRPIWIGRYPLACAHYTDSPEPLTAGGLQWTWWQHRVAPIPGVCTVRIDQSIARLPLPTIRQTEAQPAHHGEQRVDTGWIDVPWDRSEHDRLRNLAVARHTERESL